MNMKAIQPVIAFPITKFGKQNRSFQASWYINWPLLQYDANKDCALCFYCSYRFISTNLNHLFDPAFVVNGMRKWNKAREKFDSHQATNAHRDSSDYFLSKQAAIKNGTCASQLSMQYSEEIKVNRFIFKKILETIRWLSIQGIAFRGDDEYDESHNKGNFIELLQLRCIDIPELKKHLETAVNKYTSPDIQNECIHLLAMEVRATICEELIKCLYFALMVDETQDENQNVHEFIFILSVSCLL